MQNKYPLVSVIIPIYNVEQYLKTCLESVVNQTYGNIEIICVNDCTPDNSMKIVNDYCKKYDNIIILEHESNFGLGPARNTGCKAASGEYIFFLDSDDYIHTGNIFNLVTASLEHNSDLTFSRIEVFSSDDKLTSNVDQMRKYFSSTLTKKNVTINSDNFLFYLNNLPCVAWNKLYKTSFLREKGITFLNSNTPHEDEGFNIKVLLNKPKVIYVDKAGYYYLLRQNSIMDLAYNNYKSRIENLRIVLADAFVYLENIHDSELIKAIKKSNIYRFCYPSKVVLMKNFVKKTVQYLKRSF